MTREAFIRKWLANPQKQYNEQCRDEMRDDLDLVIEAALRQPPVSGSYSAEDMSRAWSEGYHRKVDEINCNELRYFDVWLANYR